MADTTAAITDDGAPTGSRCADSVSREKPVESRTRLSQKLVAVRAALWLSILTCALGCAETHEDDLPAGGDAAESIVHRLADPAHRLEAQVTPETLMLGTGPGVEERPGGLAEVANATIEDDTRYVLAGHPSARLKKHHPRLDGSGSEWAVSVALGSELQSATEIVAVPLVKLPGRKWQTLDAMLVPVNRTARGRFIDLDLPVVIPRSGNIQLQVEAHHPPGRTTSYRNRAVDIPSSAALEFSLGVLEAARKQGPVRFFIEACRDASCAVIFDEEFDPASEDAQGWQDRRVDLTPLAGSPHTLRFATEHAGDGAFSLPVWGAPTVVAATAEPDTRLNVVLLSIDTLRRDHLDLYGYDRETAPYLRKHLAARGTALENLIAEAATTDPSHMTMFTSLPALVHGVTCCRERLAVPAVTLAEILRGRGYRTAAFTENGPLAHERGFSIGFDRYIENKTPGRIRPTGHVARTFGQARSWLEERSEGPFFLFLHTFQVHAPYEPPAAYESTFAASPSRGASAEAEPIIDAYDRDLAEALLRQGRRSESIEVLLEIGNGLVRSGEPNRGVEFLERAVAVEPSSARSQGSLAQGLLESDRFGEAIVAFERTIELGGDGPGVRLYLGAALWESGRYPEAEEQYRRIVTRYPTALGAALQSLGGLLLWQGRYAEAVEPLRQAAGVVTDSVTVRFDLARALDGVGELADARQGYERVIEMAPQFSKAHYRLARLLQRQGETADAQRVMERFGELHAAEQTRTRETGLADARENLAWELLRRGQFGAAADRFRELPETPDTLAGLAASLAQAGDHGGAVSALERALQLDPGRQDLRLALADERILDGGGP